ncbi:Zn-ribbon domain-containing OB-fold protein [Microbacterium sp. CPCC 204701]|uniref:Zn-ribbon domain-containing OB-fold protein n=1 Tax=Microbacterium sp. CPCC 204701 TaxID=2493084 RepID=UPI000FDACA5D|nr:Zn-ribbon domain-containing OB-fold protein [Microbacterium sp. CPCC 204701]
MVAPAKPKPVPVPTPTTVPYWEGTARGELWIQRCVTTGAYFTYPRRFSPYVVNGEVEWVRASGRGTLYSYVVNYLPGPGYADEVPYVIAIVELEEGPRVLANLHELDPDPAALSIGMPLRAVFEPRGGLSIVQFVPDEKNTEVAA